MEILDLASSGDSCCILLSAAEREALEVLYSHVKQRPQDDLEEFIIRATLVFHSIPERLRRCLLEFKRFGNREGVLLIRGLPVDAELPPTPRDSGRSTAKSTYVSELALATFGSPLGESISYLQEKNGEFYRNICPTARNEREWSSESSLDLLPFHTEAAFHPFLPSYVMLYCLRSDHDMRARTMVASIRRIAPRLVESDIEILRQNIFETGIDYSFGSSTGKRGGGLVTAICYGANDDPYLRYDPGLMTPHGSEGQEVMTRLDAVIDDLASYVCLRPGDLLIIDNRRTVHARTEFVPRYDGLDRWLQRSYLVDGLAESARDRDGRVINTSF